MKNLNNCAITRRIRIIGGKWRGRKLYVLDSPGLRPTTNRIRETLFNWLAPSIVDSKCLDCFAGSGALGLEALSRDAVSVTFLEIKQSVIKELKKSIIKLKASNKTKVINVNTLLFLASPGVEYDVIFIDPPFYMGLLQKTMLLLEQNGWLATNAFIYVESEIENKQLIVSKHWILYRKKRIGHVICRLYKYQLQT